MTPDQAVEIARTKDASGTDANVLAYGEQGFVVGFQGGDDPYANLAIYVDAQTGNASPLAPGEYVELLPHLTQV